MPGVDVPRESVLSPLIALLPLFVLRPPKLAVSDAEMRGVCDGVGAKDEYVESGAGVVR